MRSILVTLAASAALLSTSALADSVRLNADGTMHVNSKGMTVYTFAFDPPGKSKCNDKCAEIWPPVMASKGARASGQYSVIRREDGSRQWAWRNMPLYLYSKDKVPGDTIGEGIIGAWHVTAP